MFLQHNAYFTKYTFPSFQNTGVRTNAVPLYTLPKGLVACLPISDSYIHVHVLLQKGEYVHQISKEISREREIFLFNDALKHIFIYGYMASDIWLRTILIVRKETRCRHIGYSYRLAARVLLYAPSHRQDNTYHGLCYTSRGALAGRKYRYIRRKHDSTCPH